MKEHLVGNQSQLWQWQMDSNNQYILPDHLQEQPQLSKWRTIFSLLKTLTFNPPQSNYNQKEQNPNTIHIPNPPVILQSETNEDRQFDLGIDYNEAIKDFNQNKQIILPGPQQ